MRTIIAFIICTLLPQISFADGFGDIAGVIQLMTPEQRASLSGKQDDSNQMTPAEEKEFDKLIHANDSTPTTANHANAHVFHESKPVPVETDQSVVIYPHQDN